MSEPWDKLFLLGKIYEVVWEPHSLPSCDFERVGHLSVFSLKSNHFFGETFGDYSQPLAIS